MALPCNNLNLNLYRIFYIVAKTKSFSESSRVLHISQPAISKHIQNLEYELGTQLFYRNNRGIELTSEAKQLLEYVEKAYNFLMLGEKTLLENKGLTRGKVSLGLPSYISIYYLKNMIKTYIKSHPNISIKMTCHNSETLLNLMTQHTIDMVVVPSDVEIPKGVSHKPFMEDEYCFVYNKELINANIKKIEELNDYRILLPIKNSIPRKNIENILEKKSIIINPIMELETVEMMLNYTKEGIGIGYLPKKIAEQIPEFEIIKLNEKLPSHKINIIYDVVSLTPSTKEFINHLMEREV